MPPIDETTKVLLIIIAILFACLLLASFIRKLSVYLEQRRYIEMEIHRNTGADREFWLQKKRRLWRIWLPFSKY